MTNTRSQDKPLRHWRAERELFLEELIRLEGRGITANDHCELCRNEGIYRCVDCLTIQLLCGRCLTSVHSFNPFHVIEVRRMTWTTLCDLTR